MEGSKKFRENLQETKVLLKDVSAKESKENKDVKSGEVLRTFNSLMEDGLDLAALSYALKHVDDISSGIEVNQLVDKIEAIQDNQEIEQGVIDQLISALDQKMADIEQNATSTEILSPPVSGDELANQILDTKPSTEELAAEFERKLEEAATPVDPEAEEKAKFQEALEANGKTMDMIQGELKSWQGVLKKNEGTDNEAIMKEGFDQMADGWLEDLAKMENDQAKALVAQIETTRLAGRSV